LAIEGSVEVLDGHGSTGHGKSAGPKTTDTAERIQMNSLFTWNVVVSWIVLGQTGVKQ